MAIVNGLFTKMTGSVGAATFAQRNGSTVVSQKATTVKNSRTSAQQKQRMKWANPVQVYKGVSPYLQSAFEKKPANSSDFNMFVKRNLNTNPVYLTKAEVEANACVVAPYVITNGSLPRIITSGEGADTVTDIKTGRLTIDENTTVADISKAIVLNNADYDFGEQMSFFSLLQKIDPVTGIPYVSFNASSIVLDKFNSAKLADVVNMAGFNIKNGFLAHGDDEGDGGFCWVHSKASNGMVKVSPQVLIVSNPLLADYTGKDAYKRAVATYGGEKDIFLRPETEDATGSANDNGSETDSPSGDTSNDGDLGN